MNRALPILAILTVALAVTSCKTRTVKVVTPKSMSSVDPEVPECQEADTAAFLEQHSADLNDCTQYFGCKKTGIRTVTFMLGCVGTMGSLVVLSHEDLGGYNECLVERSAEWDYSSLCTGVETDCEWTLEMDLECRVE